MRFAWNVLAWLWLVVVLAACGGDGSTGVPTTGPVTSASARASAAPGGSAQPATAPSGAPASSAAAPSTSKLPPTPATIAALPAGAPLRIGVTLHPYFSWTKNVVGDAKGVDVIAVLPDDVDAGDYQPRPDDIKKLAELDVLIVNGIGHDDFIADMLTASGNTKVVVIHANDGTALLTGAHGEAANSHTFISFTNAIQQSYAIAKILGQLRPDDAAAFQKNADDYAKRLRAIKAGAAEKLAKAKTKRVVTVHDGYSYLCQELGLEVAGVVQPAHGLTPSAKELGEMVELLKREKIAVVLTEETFPDKMLEVLKEAGNVKVYIISHVAMGKYGAAEFEDVMKKNVDTLVLAMTKDG